MTFTTVWQSVNYPKQRRGGLSSGPGSLGLSHYKTTAVWVFKIKALKMINNKVKFKKYSAWVSWRQHCYYECARDFPHYHLLCDLLPSAVCLSLHTIKYKPMNTQNKMETLNILKPQFCHEECCVLSHINSNKQKNVVTHVKSLNGPADVHSLTVSTMSVKKPKGTRGSGSSRKKSFKAPVMTWMSSQSLSSKFSFSSERKKEDGCAWEKFRHSGSQDIKQRWGHMTE